jgi:hypothetical protein
LARALQRHSSATAAAGAVSEERSNSAAPGHGTSKRTRDKKKLKLRGPVTWCGGSTAARANLGCAR